MKPLQTAVCWTLAASALAWVIPQAVAQEEDPNRITEQDKKTFQNVVRILKTPSAKSLQTLAVTNARQIGLAMFEFEIEYGEFPNEATAAVVKMATETKAEVKGETANDCFFQLIAAKLLETDHIFSLEARDKKGKGKRLERVERNFYSYLAGQNFDGNPGRPLVVAPLVNGGAVFDPKILGGKAVVLRVDNSVSVFPIEKDGRVLIDGMDLFDPAQPFWNGKVPSIKWPAK